MRPTPDEFRADLSFDAALGRPYQQPGAIFLFEDMLTTGPHYLAASRFLTQYFLNVLIVGQFIARRRIANPFENFDDE